MGCSACDGVNEKVQPVVVLALIVNKTVNEE